MKEFPTHKATLKLVSEISSFLENIGVSNHPILEELIYVTIIALISLVLGWIARVIVLFFYKASSEIAQV